MIIAVSGPQCCGKTTVLNSFRNMHNVLCEAEYVRKAAMEGFAVNETGTQYEHDKSQIYLNCHDVYTLVQHGGFSLNRTKHLIQDRCLLDKLVYSKYLHSKGKMSTDVLKMTETLWEKMGHLYEVIFYPDPHEIELVDDGFRSLDKSFRDEITKIFESIIGKHSRRIVTLHGGKKERLETVYMHMIRVCPETDWQPLLKEYQ